MDKYYDTYIKHIVTSADYIINSKPTKYIFTDLTEKRYLEKINNYDESIYESEKETNKLLIKNEYTVITPKDI